jgi:hypothetical protein
MYTMGNTSSDTAIKVSFKQTSSLFRFLCLDMLGWDQGDPLTSDSAKSDSKAIVVAQKQIALRFRFGHTFGTVSSRVWPLASSAVTRGRALVGIAELPSQKELTLTQAPKEQNMEWSHESFTPTFGPSTACCRGPICIQNSL